MAQTLVGLVLGILKWILQLGGAVLVVIGLFGNWWLVALGVVAIAVGGFVQAADRRHFDKELQIWAIDGVRDLGPIPPREVRRALAQQAFSMSPRAPGFQAGFQQLCRQWAVEQSTRRSAGGYSA